MGSIASDAFFVQRTGDLSDGPDFSLQGATISALDGQSRHCSDRLGRPSLTIILGPRNSGKRPLQTFLRMGRATNSVFPGGTRPIIPPIVGHSLT